VEADELEGEVVLEKEEGGGGGKGGIGNELGRNFKPLSP